jgi:hypothetical protein
MERIERSRLFHRLVSALAFGKRQVGGKLTNAQIYEICEMVCDDICTESHMVVAASMAGFSHAVTGRFGKDEPWPDWCDVHGLQRDFGIELVSEAQLSLEKATTT